MYELNHALPRAIVVPVENPSGVEPGRYYAVFDRSNMRRLSVWFYDADTAHREADTWVQQYGDHAWRGVHPQSVNMVWEVEPTHLDGYVYGVGAQA